MSTLTRNSSLNHSRHNTPSHNLAPLPSFGSVSSSLSGLAAAPSSGLTKTAPEVDLPVSQGNFGNGGSIGHENGGYNGNGGGTTGGTRRTFSASEWLGHSQPPSPSPSNIDLYSNGRDGGNASASSSRIKLPPIDTTTGLARSPPSKKSSMSLSRKSSKSKSKKEQEVIPEHITSHPLFSFHKQYQSEGSRSRDDSGTEDDEDEEYVSEDGDGDGEGNETGSGSFFSDPGEWERRIRDGISSNGNRNNLNSGSGGRNQLGIGGSRGMGIGRVVSSPVGIVGSGGSGYGGGLGRAFEEAGTQVQRGGFDDTDQDQDPNQDEEDFEEEGEDDEDLEPILSPATAFLMSFSSQSTSPRFVAPGVEDVVQVEKNRYLSPTGRGRSGNGSPGTSPNNDGGNGRSPPRRPSAKRSGTSLATVQSTGSQLAEDASGAVVLGYTLGKVIGRGGFSTVRLASHNETEEKVAVRIVKRDDLSDTSGSLENFERELALWKSLPPNPRILPLMAMHRTGYATYLITPFQSGGSLLDVLKKDGRGGEGMARRWFPGIVEAVRVLHEGYEGFEAGGLLHGDLKLDNFLVNGEDGRVVLCDFGLAQKLRTEEGEEVLAKDLEEVVLESRQGSRQGSRMASRDPSAERRGRSSRSRSRMRAGQVAISFPGRELSPGRHHHSTNSNLSIHHHLPSPHHHSLHPNGHGHGHSPLAPPHKTFPSASLPYAPPELLSPQSYAPSLAQDIWALGIVLHALLTSRLPFVDTFDPRLTMKIIKGDFVMPNVGEEWKQCLRGCLEGDKSKRWTMKELVGSDAINGWKSVRSRSQSRPRRGSGSRSRSSQRVPRLNDLGHTEDRGRRIRDNSSTRGGSRSRSAVPKSGNNLSSSPTFSLSAVNHHLDIVSDNNNNHHQGNHPNSAGSASSFTRGRPPGSGGTSRSRSSGRGESGMFGMDIPTTNGTHSGPHSPSLSGGSMAQAQQQFLQEHMYRVPTPAIVEEESSASVSDLPKQFELGARISSRTRSSRSRGRQEKDVDVERVAVRDPALFGFGTSEGRSTSRGRNPDVKPAGGM